MLGALNLLTGFLLDFFLGDPGGKMARGGGNW